MFRELINTVNEERNRYPRLPETMVICLGIILMLFGLTFGDVKFFGNKTEAMVDLWTFQHFCTGIIVCYITIAFRNVIKRPLIIAIAIVISWEFIEIFLEVSSNEATMYWFAGVENDWNRFLVDPLVTVIGFNFVKQCPQILWPAIVGCLSFLGVNLMSEDSMALQKWLIK
jgi:hypothetical protein